MPARRVRDENRKSLERTPILVVQEIVRTWTKAERGEPFAAARNRVPLVLPLPAERIGAPAVALIHRVEYAPSGGFLAPTSDTTRETPFAKELKLHNVAVRPLTAAVRLDMWWTWGAPWRRTRLGIHTLRPGGWAQVEYNYRSGGDYTWLYSHIVANIALVTEPPAPRLFLDTPPTRRFRDLAHLW